MYTIESSHIHPPALSELSALVAEAKEVNERLTHLNKWAAGLEKNIDAKAWTARIEKVLDKPQELETLKGERREALIAYEAAVMAYHAKRKRFWDLKDRIFKLVGPLAAQAAAMDGRSQDRWLKPLLMNACLEAEEVRRLSHPCDVPNLGHAEHNQLTLKALRTACNEVFEMLRSYRSHSDEHWNGYLLELAQGDDSHRAIVTVYPTRTIGSFRRRQHERHIAPVDFIDTVNTEHHALKRLAELLVAFEAAARKAHDAANALRNGEKGKVNERQYANRLVGVLDDTYPLYAVQGQTCGGQGQTELEAQTGRRIEYQSARQVLLSQIITAVDLRRQVRDTLKDAAAEAIAMNELVETDRRATTDLLFATRLALVNCLAADCHLRNFGQWLVEAHQEFANDLTSGRGRAATEEAFADLAKYYSSFNHTASGGGAEG